MEEFKLRFTTALSVILKAVEEDEKEFYKSVILLQSFPDELLGIVLGYFLGAGWEIPDQDEIVREEIILEIMQKHYQDVWGR